MKTILFLLCFCLNSLASDVEKINILENWVVIDVKDHQSAGVMLKSPDSETAVLIVAGSGPTDHNGNITANGMINNSYQMLDTELHQAGYSVLRFDKQGLGKSAYEAFDMSKILFSDYVNDVIAWVNI